MACRSARRSELELVSSGACTTALLAAGLASVGGDLLLVGVIERHHALAGEVQSVGSGQQREETDLDHGVVQDLVLTALPLGCVTVLELLADRAVAGRDGDTTSEDAAGLHDDVGADPGQGAVHESWRGRSHILVGLGVDGGETCKHADVGNFDVVEEEETVVHGVVAKLGSDVTNVDVLQRLVRLKVADLDHEGMGAQ